MKRIEWNNPGSSQTRLRTQRLQRSLLLLVLPLLLSVGAVRPAFAQSSASLPILLPSPVPAGYSLTEATQDSNLSLGLPPTYMYYATEGPGIFVGGPVPTKVLTISGQPATSNARELIRDLAKRDGNKAVKVGKNNGVVSITSKGGSLTWVDGKVLLGLQYDAAKVTVAKLKAIALTVRPSRLPDSSFRLTRVPDGLTERYRGLLDQLLGTRTWRADYTSAVGDSLEVSAVEAELILLELATYGFLGGTSGSAPQTVQVRGKTGVILNDAVTWEESPRVIITVESDGLSIDALVAIANSLQPVDAAAWDAAREQAQLRRSTQGGNLPVIAAGMVGVVPWTIKQSTGACFRFELAEARTDVCGTPDALAAGAVWKTVVVGDRRTIIGLAPVAATTVVLKNASGIELGRATPVDLKLPSAAAPIAKAFVFQVGEPGVLTPVADGAALVEVLDSAGALIGKPTPVTL
jgi:hypothetical protein